MHIIYGIIAVFFIKALWSMVMYGNSDDYSEDF